MKTLRLHGPHDLRLHDEPVPAPQTNEALVRVTAVGVCGSDLHWYSTGGIGDAQVTRPLVLGHEFAGVVESGALRGQRVAVDPSIPCDHCELCRAGNPNLCEEQRFAGHGLEDGAFREYFAWDSRCLFPLPDELTDEDGAMLEPLGVAIHSVDLAHLRPGMTVGVFGCGPIGLLIAQVAFVAGAARVMATEALAHRLDAAQAIGAEGFRAESGEEAQQVLSATDGRGVDIAFEVAGDQTAVDVAMTTTKPGGYVILVGVPSDDRTAFTASVARRKGLTIKLVRRMKHTFPRAIDLVTRGLVDVRSLVTHRFPLAQAGEAFAIAERREGIKVIVRP
ncbi:MAG: alcohol dehydrogenase catalytic domain-containing protein [Chloroflexi bacterium]|nr:alcohol dehydrogenase catalytic domain-containing protein [Chloroflexota bacterium]